MKGIRANHEDLELATDETRIGFPADGHPEEDMIDALRGAIRDALPEGGVIGPGLRGFMLRGSFECQHCAGVFRCSVTPWSTGIGTQSLLTDRLRA
jgi:hypothetical protein